MTTTKKQSQKFLISGIASTLVLTTILLLSVEFKSAGLFPFGVDSKYKFDTYHESLPDNYSFSTAELNNQNQLEFSYHLTSAKEEPFAGLFIYNDDSRDPFINLSDYNTIEIDLNATKAKRVPITFTIDYEGFTDKNIELTNLPFTQEINYTGPGIYSISMADFEIPSWWLREHRKEKKDFENIDFSRVNYFVIGSCPVIGSDSDDKITISAINFSNDNSLAYMTFGGIVVLINLGLLAGFMIRRKKKVIVPYQVTEMKESDKENYKIDSIVNFIAENYINPDLVASDIQSELGISTREIGKQIKNNFNCSFKTYLNTIRLAEVKRMLKETKLPVSDIAYKAGYNNISHFNRLFKNEIGVSPKAFREGEVVEEV